jgi:NAD(P)-dependent dehydrogenase (short-subunit alcohol dehydrogenase family)
MRRLENKVAIVTGGATGIGEAISKKFALEGAKVVVNGYPEDPVQDVVNDIRNMGGEASALLLIFLMKEMQWSVWPSQSLPMKKLDILINNAGVFPIMEEIHNFPTEAFEYLIKNNVRSTFLMTKFAVPELKKTRGCIVAAGSESGIIGLGKNAPYGATKGWIHAFIRGVAVEQAQHGIRANCVCPGAIDTAWTHKETGPMTAEDEKMVVAGNTIGSSWYS